MNIKTIDLPAYWCGVLVNGDFNAGLDEALNSFIRVNPTMVIHDCSDESYIGRYDGLMCDMLTYSYTEGTKSMIKLERLNNGLSAMFRQDNGSRCIVQHVYGTTCTYNITMYAKGKRLPYYGTQRSHASDAVKYVNGLGFK
jgi:hypothetical protein